MQRKIAGTIRIAAELCTGGNNCTCYSFAGQTVGSMSISNLPVYLENAISLSRKLNTVWTSGDIQLKEDLQKLIFPEGIYYDRKTQSFRTEKVNFIFELIASSSGAPPEKKKGASYLIDYLSLSAEREILPSAIP